MSQLIMKIAVLLFILAIQTVRASDNLAKATKLNTFAISGTCQKFHKTVKIGPEVSDTSEFDYFGLLNSNPIKTKASACAPKKISTYTSKVISKIRNQDFKNLEMGNNSVVTVRWNENKSETFKVKSLIPVSCTVLANPGSDDRLVLLQLESSEVAMIPHGNFGILSFILVKNDLMPKEVLKSFSPGLYEGKIAVDTFEVDKICDINSDGFAEVILEAKAYAGSDQLLVKTNQTFSKLEVESLPGLRGD